MCALRLLMRRETFAPYENHRSPAVHPERRTLEWPAGRCARDLFLSLVRLHHRMVEVKAEELGARAGSLREGVRAGSQPPTLETLEEQRNLLSAADGLEKRRRRSTTGRSTRGRSRGCRRSRRASSRFPSAGS